MGVHGRNDLIHGRSDIAVFGFLALSAGGLVDFNPWSSDSTSPSSAVIVARNRSPGTEQTVADEATEARSSIHKAAPTGPLIVAQANGLRLGVPYIFSMF